MRHRQKKSGRLAAGALWLAITAGISGVAGIKTEAPRQMPSPAPAPIEEPVASPAAEPIPPCPVGAELIPEDAAPTGPIATVTVAELNLRATPNSNIRTNIMGQVRDGDQLELIEQRSDGWLRVKTKDGRVGFVAARYVTITAAPTSARKTNVETVFPCIVPGPWCEAPNPPPARINPPQ